MRCGISALMVSSMLVCLVVGTVVLMSSSASAQCFSSNDSTRGNLSVEGLLNGSTTFGLNLFTHLAQNERSGSTGNVLLSPFSVWSALVITYLGSKGRTEQEMRQVLGVGNSAKADIARAYKAVKFWYLLRTLSQTNYTLKLANRIYMQKDMRLRDCIQQYYGNDLELLDFARSPEASRGAINSWIEQKTNQKIRNLLPSGSIDASTALVLVNAAYFKGLWDSQFKPANNRKADFFVSHSRTVLVEMMRQRGEFYFEQNMELDAQVLELQFAGEDVSMIFLLPMDAENDHALEDLLGRLNVNALHRARNRLWRHEVDISIPKFRLEHSFELAPVLAALGMRDLLDPSTADLSGFTDEQSKGSSQPFAVNSVRHKAFLEVSEQGSEAAAATAVVSWRSARPLRPDTFIANRPFIFYLHDNLSNVILFLGAVRRPQGTNDI